MQCNAVSHNQFKCFQIFQFFSRFWEFDFIDRVPRKVFNSSLHQHCITRCICFFIIVFSFFCNAVTATALFHQVHALLNFVRLSSDATFLLWQICADVCTFKIVKFCLSQSHENVPKLPELFKMHKLIPIRDTKSDIYQTFGNELVGYFFSDCNNNWVVFYLILQWLGFESLRANI